MRTYEQTFANPLLALAFKAGVDIVGDQDITATAPRRANDGSKNWVVMILDETEDEEDDNPVVIECSVPSNIYSKDVKKNNSKVSFEEFKELTKKNMVPKTLKLEDGGLFTTISEPNNSKPPGKRGSRTIIPDPINIDDMMD